MKTAVLICLAIAPLLSAQDAAPLEQEVLLRAGDFLPADLLRGPSYRVRDQVPTDGYLAYFEIDSDFGTFPAVGVPAARRKIAEAEAIRKLAETRKGDLFAEGMKRSIEQPIDAVKNIVEHPVQSVKNAPKTIGHFFVKIGTSIGRGVSQIEEQVASDSPPSAGEIGRGIGNAAKNAAGFDKALLDTARQLGVDPYSDNPRLQEEMEKVTWAFFAGGLPLKVGAAAASAGLAVTATTMVGVPEDTYALTSGELTLRDQRALEAMGVNDEDIARFLTHSPLGITRRHRMVLALESLKDARGRGDIIKLANSCATPQQADVLAEALSILAEQARSGTTTYVSLHALGRLPVAETLSGGREVPAPVDYVTWTEEVAAFAHRDDIGTGQKTLLHTGRLSPAVAAGLTAAGWRYVAVDYVDR